MTIASEVSRPLGTMVAYGFAEVDLEGDFDVARRLGAGVLEIFPDWRVLPDPRALRARVDDLGLAIHSAHGCWGGKSIRAARVDLGSPEAETHRESVEDLKRCVDWLHEVGGVCLVVHPGGLSDPAQTAPRRDALAGGLIALADHSRDTGVVLCVENMPPGVHPGSRMVDLAALITDLGRPELALRSTPATPGSSPTPTPRPSPRAPGSGPPMSTITTAARTLTSPPARGPLTGTPGPGRSRRSPIAAPSCWNASGTSATTRDASMTR